MSRSNGYTSYRGGSTARPSSAELVEIHVYIVPPDVWREHYNNLLNQQVTELISAGIIRVHGEQKLCVLRDDIVQQIGADLLPRDFVFLRGVGRSITKLRTKQEYQLKAKHFALPIAHTPELYLLEISPEERDRSSQGSTRPQTRSPVYTNNESEDERQSSKAKQMHSSPYRYSPLPKIRSSKSPPRQMSPPKQYSSHRQISPSKQRSVPNSERSPPNDRHYQNNMTPQDEVMPQRQMTAQSHNTPLRQRSPDGPLNVEQNGDIRSEHLQFYESVDSNRDRQSVSRSHRSSRQSPPPKEEQPTARLSATPPHSADRQRKPYKSDKYDAYTNHTNEDSGINVLTPEDQYEADRRKHEEEQRQQDLQKRLQPADEDDRENGQRRLQDEQDDDEWERRRREEEERRQREEEERRRREEERRRREEEENRRAEEERQRLQEDRDRMAKEQKFSGSDEGIRDDSYDPWVDRKFDDKSVTKTEVDLNSLQKESSAPQVVVRINDEINGQMTPRVIVQVNGNADNVAYDDRYESDHSRKSVMSQRSYVERKKTATVRYSQPASNSDNIKRSYTYEKDSELSPREKDGRASRFGSEYIDRQKHNASKNSKNKEVSWSDTVRYENDSKEQERQEVKPTVTTIKEDSKTESDNYLTEQKTDSLKPVKTDETRDNDLTEQQNNYLKPFTKDEARDKNVSEQKNNYLNPVVKDEARGNGGQDHGDQSQAKNNQIVMERNRTNSFEKSDAETVYSSKNRRASIISSGYQGDLSDFGESKAEQINRVKAKGQTESQRNMATSRTSNRTDSTQPTKDLNRFPSPPPMHRNERDTESGKLQRKEEIEKLKKELEAAREQRRLIEKQREELVKKAKLMQTKTQNRRNHARDIWKKRYFEEKKKTPPLEEQCNRLRHELDIIHRKLMNTLEGPTKEKSTRTADLKPSQKNNYKIQATRLTHEIDDVRRRLENAKMKLTAEMKLRNQAETELRALRAELTQKKIHLTLSRNQQLAAMTPATSQELYTAPALTPRS